MYSEMFAVSLSSCIGHTERWENCIETVFVLLSVCEITHKLHQVTAIVL